VARSETVTIPEILADEFGYHPDGVTALVARGHVSLDGRVISMHELTWKREDLRGRMLKAGQHSRRLFGGRPIEQRPVEEVGTAIALDDPDAQMELGL
jgi:hypothetical protein